MCWIPRILATNMVNSRVWMNKVILPISLHVAHTPGGEKNLTVNFLDLDLSGSGSLYNCVVFVCLGGGGGVEVQKIIYSVFGNSPSCIFKHSPSLTNYY